MEKQSKKNMRELTRTRWVILNGKEIKVSDLPPEHVQALVRRVQRKPMENLGYILEEKTDEENI